MVDPVVVVMSVKSEECEVVEIGDDVSGEVLAVSVCMMELLYVLL